MIQVFLQIILFYAIFWLLYKLLFQRDTLFYANRIYLLLTSLLAGIIPFIHIRLSDHQAVSNPLVYLSEVWITNDVLKYPEVSTSYLPVIIWIYAIGVLVAAVIFVVKLSKLVHYIRTAPKHYKDGIGYITLPDSTQVFSFLNYIFLGDRIPQSQLNFLIIHEKIHVQQKHSWDLLWFEFLRILLWFNPLVYIYQKQIALLHEYIADEKTKNTLQPKHYYNELLNAVFQVENIAFINQFYNQSLIKKRIIMMTKKQSNPWKLVKYVALIPVIALLLLSCADNNEITTQPVISQDSRTSDETVVFSTIDKAPIYPGCEDLANFEEQKQCFSKNIQQFVAQNFNIDLAQNLDLKSGKKRIFTMFIIDNSGNITDIRARAPHKALEEEAIRVIKLLPKMTPGVKDGEYVNTKYSLPITFLVK